MTPNKEDYLKAIYKLGGTDTLVNNKQIAAALQIAPGSVTEMLGKLRREGLLHYEAYKGSRLTHKGMNIAVTLVRGHRLWEVFLIQHLGYSWSEAHEDAELLEHITPSRLTARLDQYLNYPAYCPHGSAIPRPDGQVQRAALRPLTQLAEGQTARICRVTEEPELLDYLQQVGITIGSEVRILEAGAYEGPLTLNLGDREVQVSYKAACQIFVDGGENSPQP